MSGFVWASNITLPVYAVGDGLFMQRVMNAIAALSNSGVLASLGLLGLMLGLLLMVMKAMQTGGRDVEIPSIFTSLIMYGIMFGGTCNVMIQDVGNAPGQYANATYVVDHVPFGVAAMGWLISNVSYELTEKLEQAYSVPGATDDDVMHVGFNRTLDWLTALRFIESPGINSTDHTIQRFKTDLTSYLTYCTSKAMVSNPGLVNTVMEAPDPFDSSTGIGFNSKWDTFGFYDLAPNSTAPETDVTCADGITKLKAYKDGGLFNAVASAVAVPNSQSGSQSATSSLASAWNLVNVPMGTAANFYASGMINDALHTSLAGVPVAGDMQIGNAMMIDNANAQRATTFAAQESMFRSIMRPLMAFFESLVYIAAPFMVMAVGLGGFGIKLVGRYALATTWVSMWMPTLAAINLYQQTAVQEVIVPFITAPPGSTGATYHSLTSLFGSNLAYSQLDNLIATGALLAASTPAITAFLLFASVQAMNGVFSSAQGGSALNAKVGMPDAMNTPATATRGSNFEGSMATGMSQVGAVAPPSLNISSGQSLTRAEAAQASDRLSATYNEKFGAAAGQSISSFYSSQGNVTSASTSALQSAANNVVSAAKSQGFSVSAAEAIGWLQNQTISTNNSAGYGFNGGATAGMSEGGSGGSAGFNMDAGAKAGAGTTGSTSQQGNKGIGSDKSHSLGSNKAIQAAISDGQSNLVAFAAAHGSQSASQLTNSTEYAKVATQMSSATRSYTDTGAASSGIVASQQLDLKGVTNSIGQMFTDGNGRQDLGAAAAYVSGKAQAAGVSADRIATAQQDLMKGSGMDREHAMVAGALVAMASPEMPGAARPEAGSRADQDARLTQQAAMGELIGMISKSGAAQLNVGGAASVNPEKGSIGADASQASHAKADVVSHSPGVNFNATAANAKSAAGESAEKLVDGAAKFGGMQQQAADARSAGDRASTTVQRNPDGTVNEAAFDGAHGKTEKEWKGENFDQRLKDRQGFGTEQRNQTKENTSAGGLMGLLE